MVKHIIHKTYREDLHLSKKECADLYTAFHDYGKNQILEAAYNMYSRDETPLHKNWEDDADFLLCFTSFYKLAKSLNIEDFTDFIISGKKISLPKLFDRYEMELLGDQKQLKEQACLLLGFIDTLSDYFDYEVLLTSLGYPPEPFNAKNKKII